jgi:hypothetical protein
MDIEGHPLDRDHTRVALAEPGDAEDHGMGVAVQRVVVHPCTIPYRSTSGAIGPGHTAGEKQTAWLPVNFC